MENTAPKLLNHEEIKARQIFNNPNGLNATNATINLTVGTILDLKNHEEVNEYKIPPRGMVLVVSAEEMKIPEDVIGYTTVKNGLSLRGIMAVNIGIVDNQWQGPISSILINFGKDYYKLKQGEVFLRMTFHEFSKPTVNAKEKALPPLTNLEYMAQRKNDARAYLSDNFLVLDQVTKKIRKQVEHKLLEKAKTVTIVLAIVTVAISAVVYVVSYSNDVLKYWENVNSSKGIKMINTRLDSLKNVQNEREKALENELETLKTILKDLQQKESPKEKNNK